MLCEDGKKYEELRWRLVSWDRKGRDESGEGYGMGVGGVWGGGVGWEGERLRVCDG